MKKEAFNKAVEINDRLQEFQKFFDNYSKREDETFTIVLNECTRNEVVLEFDDRELLKRIYDIIVSEETRLKEEFKLL